MFDHTYAMLRFGARVTPPTVLLDSRGGMVGMHVGQIALAGLKANVRQHFGAESSQGALE